jgi:hypothetical protein
MDEFEVFRKHVAQPVAVNRVRVPAAHLHDPVVPARIDLTGYLASDTRDNRWIPKLIDVF